ncbi:curli assembly chaperone CsgC, partial [Escherichia coli]|uniref:curli assembly chaperone CsgC n=1 Tax=Escherichia coli TaxID=562 RepID=UPI003B83E3A2
LWHLCCSEVSISPLFRWPNSVNHFKGSSGQSQTKQEKTLSLPANQPIALTKLSLNISPDDRVKIVVTVSDGQSLHLSQQWPPSSEKS